jgi:AraC-like DNA-binding protein
MDGGDASPSHFAHVFRKKTGISPHEYRERTLGDVATKNLAESRQAEQNRASGVALTGLKWPR